jgi:hypothetical protein
MYTYDEYRKEAAEVERHKREDSLAQVAELVGELHRYWPGIALLDEQAMEKTFCFICKGKHR